MNILTSKHPLQKQPSIHPSCVYLPPQDNQNNNLSISAGTCHFGSLHCIS